jgi:hypothetical protein
MPTNGPKADLIPQPAPKPDSQEYRGPVEIHEEPIIRQRPTAAEREGFYLALRTEARKLGRPLNDAEFAAVAARF